MMRTIRAGALTSLISSYQMGSIPMSVIMVSQFSWLERRTVNPYVARSSRAGTSTTGFFISLNFHTSLNKMKQGIACKGYNEGSFNGRTGDFDSLDVSSILAPSAIQIRTATHILWESAKFKVVGSSPTVRKILRSSAGQSIKGKTYLIYRECGVMVALLIWVQEEPFKSDIFDHLTMQLNRLERCPVTAQAVGSSPTIAANKDDYRKSLQNQIYKEEKLTLQV